MRLPIGSGLFGMHTAIRRFCGERAGRATPSDNPCWHWFPNWPPTKKLCNLFRPVAWSICVWNQSIVQMPRAILSYVTLVLRARSVPETGADGLLFLVQEVTEHGVVQQELMQRHNELRLLQQRLERQNLEVTTQPLYSGSDCSKNTICSNFRFI